MEIRNPVLRMIFGRRPKRTLIRVVLLAVLCIVVCRYMALPVRISGISMEPTLKNGSFRFVNLIAYKTRSPQPGDVVAIRMAGLKVMYLKRIVGMPGEKVAFQNGRLQINGRDVHESYIRDKGFWSMPPVQLSSSEFFVVGDNRTTEQEGHVMGVVGANQIVGPLF